MAKKRIKIEDSFYKLEEIVALIESGEIGLEESLEHLKTGMILANDIKKRLSQIQSELESLDGQLS